MVEDQAQEGRVRRQEVQGVDESDQGDHDFRALERRRQRQSPVARRRRQGARGQHAQRHHRSRHQEGHGRTRGRELRGIQLRSLRSRRHGHLDGNHDRQSQPHDGRDSQPADQGQRQSRQLGVGGVHVQEAGRGGLRKIRGGREQGHRGRHRARRRRRARRG